MKETAETAVKKLRAFNRFHTRFTGVLDSSFMGSGLSLAEARVLFEIATRERCLASDIRTELGLDPGYLSRIVVRFERRGWVVRGRGADARQRPIDLTGAGRIFFEDLDGHVHDRASASIAHLEEGDREALVEALSSVQELLSKAQPQP